MIHIYIDDYYGNEVDGICKLVDDIFEESNSEKKCSNGERRTGMAYRRIEDKKKDRRRREIIGFNYDDSVGWPCCRVIDGELVDCGYLKYPKNSNRQKYLKKQSNRKVRRSGDIYGKGNGYRKEFDYWWNLI